VKRELFFGSVLGLLVFSSSAQHPVIGGYNVYYGDLHNHSGFSDGDGTPAEAYSYARNTAHLDFFGLSDHSTYLSSAQFAVIRDQADASNQDGVFTTFYGFEWSSKAGYGHVTVFNTADFCPATAPALSLSDLLNWLQARPEGLAFFNHPGDEDSIGIEFNHFSIPPSNQMVGIELWNRNRGFTRFYYNDGYYHNDNNKSYIDEANNRGWRLGALGSDDNHTGTYGTDVPYRMAILSENLTRGDLLSAIRERRFYATLDENLSLSFKINGKEMGSSVAGGIDTVHIQAHDTDGEMFSEVVMFDKSHNIVNTWTLNSDTPDLTLILNTSEGDYYYVKVRQADGDEAISSPVWITPVMLNQYPVCSIISPGNNAIFTAPANFTIIADATDADGSVSKVEFFHGTTKLGESLSAPYSFMLNNMTPGSYILTARATDNSGAVTTSLPVTIKINARPVTVMADVRTKVYGYPDPVLTYRITSGTLAGTDSFTGNLTRDPGENAGIYPVRQGTLALNDNYVITFQGSGLTITKRPVRVNVDPQTKVYGDPDPVLTYKVTSGILVKEDSFSGSPVRNNGEDIGRYSITKGNLALSNNYDLVFTGADFNILPRVIAVAADHATKVYGDSDPQFTCHITSGSLAYNGDVFTGSLIRDAGEDAGVYAIKRGTLALNKNYNLTFSDAYLEIFKREVTVTVNDRKKVYGESDPELTYRITSGSLAGPDEFEGAPARTPGEEVGTYLITRGDLSLSSNYILTFIGGYFRITETFEVLVYPIPFKDHLSMELELNNGGHLSITLFNLTGVKQASVFSGNVLPGTYRFNYSSDKTATGILILQVIIDGKIVNAGKVIHE
jgi:hypothetical protein